MMKFIKNTLNSFIGRQDYISPTKNDLSENVIVVTGATHGIGLAITNVLLRHGATVVGISRNGGQIDPNISSFKNKYYPISCDVTMESQVKDSVQKITTEFGKIDALVNNAGKFSFGKLEDVTVEEFESVYNLNVKGSFLTTRAVLPIMKNQKRGCIINIGSKISHNTKIEPYKVLYTTTKYALEGFSFALNREVKPFGIRVCCVMPGTVNTFISKNSKNFMSPYDVAEIVKMIISMSDIDFESIVFKAQKQDL